MGWTVVPVMSVEPILVLDAPWRSSSWIAPVDTGLRMTCKYHLALFLLDRGAFGVVTALLNTKLVCLCFLETTAVAEASHE